MAGPCGAGAVGPAADAPDMGKLSCFSTFFSSATRRVETMVCCGPGGAVRSAAGGGERSGQRLSWTAMEAGRQSR